MEHFNKVVATAITRKASDIHLTVGAPPIGRIAGRLHPLDVNHLTAQETEKIAKSIFSENQYEKYLLEGESDTSYNYMYNGTVYSFRVHVFNQKNNCGIAMRYIPTAIPTMEELNLPDVFRQLCMKRRGLILITGPTGSGKTTTLAAMLEYITRTRNEHIITIEDPIEYVFPHGKGIVNQRQVGTDTKSFSSAIRAALREDPDVLMIGEMRDMETISAAITAAETGHLVLATLHTMGASKSIDRIIDVFPPSQQAQIRGQLSSVLQAVVSQQLIPNQHQDGRSLALEIMLMNHCVQNLIREGKTNQIMNAMQLNAVEGMKTMDQSLLELYKKGLISKDCLLGYAVNEKEMSRKISA